MNEFAMQIPKRMTFDDWIIDEWLIGRRIAEQLRWNVTNSVEQIVLRQRTTGRFDTKPRKKWAIQRHSDQELFDQLEECN